jgi:hypothetical protein
VGDLPFLEVVEVVLEVVPSLQLAEVGEEVSFPFQEVLVERR